MLDTTLAKPLWVALHGQLTVHPWRDPVAAESDVYQLFVARSSAMGWLAEAAEGAIGGLWGMNDAQQEPESGIVPSHAVWFQVDLVNVGDALLPVQPFLACAADVISRIGILDVQAVQMLLPIQSLEVAALASPHLNATRSLARTAGWFSDSDPSARAKVTVTLDGGQVPTITSVAPSAFRWAQEFLQDVFLLDSFSLAHDRALQLVPTIIDELWTGPAHHRATFRGSLAEWSLDALAWSAAFLAEACYRHGIKTPLLFTAGRSEDGDSGNERSTFT